MTKHQVLDQTREFVRKKLEKETTGHDWFHIERVVRWAKLIGRREKADLFIVELAALLHDIADWKFYADPEEGVRVSHRWLTKLNVESKTIDAVCYIVQNISFKGGTNKHKMSTIEGKVVQDADRLDAMGAIGIARAFTYGGHVGKPMYDPEIKPVKLSAIDLEAYKTKGTVINHFYEKILWLRDLMNTKTGYKLAGKREVIIKDFLKQFYKEWEGKQ